MPTSQVDVTTKSIDESPVQQNTTVTGALAFFRSITVHPVSSEPNPDPSIQKSNDYDFLVSSVSDAATATVTSASPLSNTFANGTITPLGVTATVFATATATLLDVQVGDTVTINGLTYTGVSGVKANNTEFTVSGGDTVDAADLADSINNDVRSGTIGDVSATVSITVVTITTDVLGAGGNAVTLAETGTTITISGATFTGGVNGDTVTVNGLVYSAQIPAVGSDFTRFSILGGNTDAAVSLADSITNDARVGTLGDVTATANLAVTTVTFDQVGVGGNAVTLVSSDGTRLAVSGSGTLTGGGTGDTVTVNGLLYTAVAGVKADNTEFSIDSTDTATATDLADSITNDTRTGVIGDVIAESIAAVVTLTQTLGGTVGNATTIVSSSGTRLAVSGATFTGGTDGPVTVNIATRSIIVAKSIGVPVSVSSFFTSLINDTTAAFFAIQKDNKEGGIDYDLIYTAEGAGAVTLDLNIVTLEVPIGTPTPSFPVVPNIADPVQVFSVLRETTGLVKIYDYFMLSLP